MRTCRSCSWLSTSPGGRRVRFFDRLAVDGFEQVVYCHEPSSGLRAIIAIHSTRLGPALGGTRWYPYDTDEAALEDVLRLARGMTYKAAAAGLDLGGGKAVIIGDPRTDRSEALLRAYGRHVESLGGRYVTAEDVGTSTTDMDIVRRETDHVVGLSTAAGGSGDPSPATARGVLHAMQATAEHLWGTSNLTGRHVVVTGLGKVGGALVQLLAATGAHVTVGDRDVDVMGRVAGSYGVEAVSYQESHAVPCDIWSPCALGGVLDASTIPELRCRAIVGAANNQLADPSCALALAETGTTYLPDFVVNAGGLIHVADEMRGYQHDRAYQSIAGIESTVRAVLTTAETEGITTLDAANRFAERRIDEISSLAIARRRRRP